MQTEAVLTFDPVPHRYAIGQQELISVTQALTEAGLIDARWFSEESAQRGSYVHQAVLLHTQDDLAIESLDPVLAPYFAAYQAFLSESGFIVVGCEERLFDAALGCAGTLDLRGVFPKDKPGDVEHVIDVKTGAVPATVGYQTAGYCRMLPRGQRRLRWALNLRDDGGYRLTSLVKRTDEAVFLAALTVAKAKRGWL